MRGIGVEALAEYPSFVSARYPSQKIVVGELAEIQIKRMTGLAVEMRDARRLNVNRSHSDVTPRLTCNKNFSNARMDEYEKEMYNACCRAAHSLILSTYAVLLFLPCRNLDSGPLCP